MKKALHNFKIFTLLTIMMGTSFLYSNAQITVTVGSGIADHSQLPIYSCFAYNYSQSIHVASELSALPSGVTITKIKFFFSLNPGSTAEYKDWVVYLGNTTVSSFASSSSWIPVASLTEVFNGVVTFPPAGNWMELTLSTPFVYTGNNIVVAVDENTIDWYCTADWGSYVPSATSDRSILYYSDFTNPSPAAPPIATELFTDVPRMQFVYTVNCAAPVSLSASATTATTSTFTWDNVDAASSYIIEYGPEGFVTGTGITVTTTDTFYLATGLVPNTGYEYRVRQVCAPGDSSIWSPGASFATLCQAPSIVTRVHDSVCDNGIMTLKAIPTTNATVNWYDDPSPTAAPILIDDTVFTTPDLSTTTTYWVQATVGNLGGCQSSKLPVMAKVFPSPVVNISPDADTVCNGDSVLYAVTGASTSTYLWSNGATTNSTYINTPGNVTATVTTNKGCATTDTAQLINFVSVTVDGFDYIPLLYTDPYTVKFAAINPIDVVSYHWDFGDGNTSTDEFPIHTYAAAGTYTVTLNVNNDCGDDAISLDINVEEPNTIEHTSLNQYFTIYPNPTSNFLNIESKTNNTIENLKVYNVLGQLVLEKNQLPNKFQLDISQLSKGNYLLTINNKNGRSIIKFTVN